MEGLLSFLKALAEQRRIEIIQLLGRQEMCVEDLIAQLNISQACVSHHIRILKEAGIVQVRRTGRWSFYSLNRDALHMQWQALQDGFVTPILEEQFE